MSDLIIKYYIGMGDENFSNDHGRLQINLDAYFYWSEDTLSYKLKKKKERRIW